VSGPWRIYTYGEAKPRSAFFSLYGHKNGSLLAYSTPIADLRRYEAVYGEKPDDIRWSYGVPFGTSKVDGEEIQ
jgi:hypothetical protein